MTAHNDMRVDDPTRARVAPHITLTSGRPTVARPAYQLSVVQWNSDPASRVCLYMHAEDGVQSLAFLPTPEELIATGKVMIAAGEAALAKAEREAAEALAKVRR